MQTCPCQQRMHVLQCVTSNANMSWSAAQIYVQGLHNVCCMRRKEKWDDADISAGIDECFAGVGFMSANDEQAIL